jgi:ACS family sodium-dependent inorganic phosphate cotransporter
MFTQIPGGVLAERFGGKNVILFPMLVGAVLTLLSPLAATIHVGALIAVRIGIGLCQVNHRLVLLYLF